MEVDEIETQVCKFQRVSSNGLQWPSSRIVRVSRASGGKDRHSKVLTSKGLRDRRVRLSVGTAIQFYDLQDRLGYDQPSKAVEWLLKAAAASIDELPSLDPSFSGELEKKMKSPAGSSTSETSKGSGLSLARSENRVKARERAREMAASKEKEKESVPENSSFTDLLTGGVSSAAVSRPVPTAATPMDYLFQTPQFSFLQESFVPAATTAGDEGSYSLNFSGASTGLARGTLQSNLQSSFLPLHRLQDGSNLPFFIVPNGVVSEHFPATVGFGTGTGAGGRHSDHHKERANN